MYTYYSGMGPKVYMDPARPFRVRRNTKEVAQWLKVYRDTSGHERFNAANYEADHHQQAKPEDEPVLPFHPGFLKNDSCRHFSSLLTNKDECEECEDEEANIRRAAKAVSDAAVELELCLDIVYTTVKMPPAVVRTKVKQYTGKAETTDKEIENNLQYRTTAKPEGDSYDAWRAKLAKDADETLNNGSAHIRVRTVIDALTYLIIHGDFGDQPGRWYSEAQRIINEQNMQVCGINFQSAPEVYAAMDMAFPDIMTEATRRFVKDLEKAVIALADAIRTVLWEAYCRTRAWQIFVHG